MSTLRLGDTAPDFTQDSSVGPIRFHEWAGDSWVILFSHPADFTPVCTTELGRTAALSGEFAKRGVKPIAISVDPVDKHQLWIADINDTQNTTVDFPILADADRQVSELYDLIHPNASATATVRSVFFIDPKKTIRATLTYPASTGRRTSTSVSVVADINWGGDTIERRAQRAGLLQREVRVWHRALGGDTLASSAGVMGMALGGVNSR